MSLPLWEGQIRIDDPFLGMSKACVIVNKRAGSGPDSSLILSTVRRRVPAFHSFNKYLLKALPATVSGCRQLKLTLLNLSRKIIILELNLKRHRINRQAGELSSKTGRSHEWDDKNMCCPCNLPLARGFAEPPELQPQVGAQVPRKGLFLWLP